METFTTTGSSSWIWGMLVPDVAFPLDNENAVFINTKQSIKSFNLAITYNFNSNVC